MPRILAQGGGIARDVQYIIRYLKGNAQFLAVSPQRRSARGIGPAQHGAAFTGQPQQRACLFCVEFGQFRFGKRSALSVQIEHLASGHARRACRVRRQRQSLDVYKRQMVRCA